MDVNTMAMIILFAGFMIFMVMRKAKWRNKP